MRAPSGTHARIYAVVRRIPRGRVATYGQVATLAGFSGQARLVGYALAALESEAVPWHRVVNARGEISPRATPGYEAMQRALLETEGIAFSGNRIELKRWQWSPGRAGRAKRGRSA
jgi:methylated-DNA-protein-cysteine methyltransferase related protein